MPKFHSHLTLSPPDIVGSASILHTHIRSSNGSFSNPNPLGHVLRMLICVSRSKEILFPLLVILCIQLVIASAIKSLCLSTPTLVTSDSTENAWHCTAGTDCTDDPIDFKASDCAKSIWQFRQLVDVSSGEISHRYANGSDPGPSHPYSHQYTRKNTPCYSFRMA